MFSFAAVYITIIIFVSVCVWSISGKIISLHYGVYILEYIHKVTQKWNIILYTVYITIIAATATVIKTMVCQQIKHPKLH